MQLRNSNKSISSPKNNTSYLQEKAMITQSDTSLILYVESDFVSNETVVNTLNFFKKNYKDIESVLIFLKSTETLSFFFIGSLLEIRRINQNITIALKIHEREIFNCEKNMLLQQLKERNFCHVEYI